MLTIQDKLNCVNMLNIVIQLISILLGIDSSSTACIVSSMCRLVCKAVEAGNVNVLADIRKVVKDDEYVPKDEKELCERIFVTCYLGTVNSSDETRNRAENLAKDIGSCHLGGLFRFLYGFGFCPTFHTVDKS